MTGGRAGGSRVRTVFLGSGGFGRAALRALVAHPYVELVGVITAPPRSAGRRRVATPTPIHELARELAIEPILTPERLRAPAALSNVLDLLPDLAVLVDYGQIVPPTLLGLRHGALNLHPSLLPRHRGATPIPAAILAGDAETGVSLIRMDEGLDSGPIVAERSIPLDGIETAPELEAVLEPIAASLLADQLEAWLRGETLQRPQDDGAATMTRPLRRDDGWLDPARPAVGLERQVRAYQPWPGSFVETQAGRVVVWRSTALSSRPIDRPNTLTDDDGDGIALATVDGRLRFDEIQPAGGRRMSGPAWRRGLRPWPLSIGRPVRRSR